MTLELWPVYDSFQYCFVGEENLSHSPLSNLIGSLQTAIYSNKTRLGAAILAVRSGTSVAARVQLPPSSPACRSLARRGAQGSLFSVAFLSPKQRSLRHLIIT